MAQINTSLPPGFNWSWDRLSPIYVPGLALALTAPLILLCLPHTLAIAKIRRAHVLRAAVFGLGWISLPGVLRLPRTVVSGYTLSSVGLIGGRPSAPPFLQWLDSASWYLHRFWYITLTLVVVWSLIWWAAVIRAWFTGNDRRWATWAVLVPSVMALCAALTYNQDVIYALARWFK